jgi:hypothetical protein
MMEELSSSEKSFLREPLGVTSQDAIIHSHRRECLKSYMSFPCLNVGLSYSVNSILKPELTAGIHVFIVSQ